jgi:fucose permease
MTGWIVTFLIDARGGSPNSAYVLTALFGCFTLSRALLPRLTSLIGEKRALLLYQTIAIGLYLLIWRLKNLIAVSAMAALVGLVAGVSGISQMS